MVGLIAGYHSGAGMNDMTTNLTDEIRHFWEQNPCGTRKVITGDLQQGTIEWFERIEEYRYGKAPFIHSVAQFTRHHGKKILEIGVGVGVDHLQWARAGAECHGVDLTEAAIDITRTHLSMYGFESDLQCVNAEGLPFPDASFDVVYSWGVIHHSENPQKMIKEINRVLKPSCNFIGMMYHRHSVTAFRTWIKYAFMRRKFWWSFSDVLWHNRESIGTKAYTISELKELFVEFNTVHIKPLITVSDTRRCPAWLSTFIPDQLGWLLAIRATK